MNDKLVNLHQQLIMFNIIKDVGITIGTLVKSSNKYWNHKEKLKVSTINLSQLLFLLNTELCINCNKLHPNLECQECYRWTHQDMI